MAGIDLNKYYQTLISSGSDPIEAAQLAAYQYLDNPSGSITQIKQPAKWYTEKDWFTFSAPDYLTAVNYVGDDPVANKVAEFAKSADFTLPGISKFVRENRDIFAGQDGYAQLKDLYDQRESARKGYEKQVETHEFSQFGLPDPTIRYGVVEREQDGKKYVPYKPAVEYVNKKQKDYYTKLIASGIDAKSAAQRTAMYQQKLVGEVESKIAQAGLSPFVEKVAQLRKIKK